MTPLPILLLLVAAYAPASVVLQSQQPGEVVTSESTRDVTRTQSSTSQSSETKRITSGDFQNTTNTSRSTAIENRGASHERTGARAEGSYTLHELKDLKLKDDNKTGPNGSERTQTMEATKVNNISVADANGRNPLQVGKLERNLVEDVTRTGASSGPAKENTERSTVIRTATVGEAPDVQKITLTDDNIRRSVDGEDSQGTSSSTVEVEESSGARMSLKGEGIATAEENKIDNIGAIIKSRLPVDKVQEIRAGNEGTRQTDRNNIGRMADIKKDNIRRRPISILSRDLQANSSEAVMGRIQFPALSEPEESDEKSESQGRFTAPKRGQGTLVSTEAATTPPPPTTTTPPPPTTTTPPPTTTTPPPTTTTPPPTTTTPPPPTTTTPPPPTTTTAPLPEGKTDSSETLPQLDFRTIAPITTSAPEPVTVTTPVPDSDKKTTPLTPGSGLSFVGSDNFLTLPPPPAATTTPKPSTTPQPHGTTGDYVALRYSEQGQLSECPNCKAPCEEQAQQGCCWMSSSYCLESYPSGTRLEACDRCWGDEQASNERWNHI